MRLGETLLLRSAGPLDSVSVRVQPTLLVLALLAHFQWPPVHSADVPVRRFQGGLLALNQNLMSLRLLLASPPALGQDAARFQGRRQ